MIPQEKVMSLVLANQRECVHLKSVVLLDVISEIITDSTGDTPATTTEVEKFLSEL